MDAADEVFRRSLDSDKATLAAARLASQQKFAEAAKAIDKAEAASKALTKARADYLRKAKPCRA
jgi:hypothetical protein